MLNKFEAPIEESTISIKYKSHQNKMAIKLMTSETTEPRSRSRRRLSVRINPTRLEGGALSSGATIRVETRLGFRNKQSLLSLSPSPKRELRRASGHKVVGQNGGAVEWDGSDGVLENSCSDQCQFDLSFSVLRKVEGRDQKSEKWEEMGRVGMKIEDLGKRKEMEMMRRLPIRLQGNGTVLALVSTLTVLVSVSVEEGGDVLGGDLGKPGFLRWLSYSKRNKVVGTSAAADSGELIRSNSLPSPKRRGVLRMMGSLFTGYRRKVEPVELKKMDGGRDEHDKVKVNGDDFNNENGIWQVQNIVSRDGEVELKCSVGLASFDQCSAKVAGEGACSVIVAVVAHWLHLNKSRVPNRAELDRLMVEGAAEWKKLGENEAYHGGFADNHFDIETVVRAGIRPLRIKQESSVVGFFSPDKFELLKGAVCIDGIWSDIERKAGVYIVSWNDHFCVLKVEDDACYLIDSLGRRLKEGCDQAFILKFDESSVMKHCRPEGDAECVSKETSSIAETEEAEAGCVVESVAEEEGVKIEDEKIICRGRECCKEFFKRFLAAILVKQLEAKEERGIVGTSDLYKRLQIEFQYTTSLKK